MNDVSRHDMLDDKMNLRPIAKSLSPNQPQHPLASPAQSVSRGAERNRIRRARLTRISSEFGHQRGAYGAPKRTGKYAVDFYDVVSTTWTNRFYTQDPVDLAVLERAFDIARFGPQGGNRQPVHFIVVTDPDDKAKLKSWYLGAWNEYVDRARKKVIAKGGQPTCAVPKYLKQADEFANALDEIPVLIVVVAELASLHATDLDTGRLSIVGGGSVYPTIQNFLLGLRSVGLGGAMTTLLCQSEAEVKELLGVPDNFVTAACVAVGWPARGFPKRLNRKPVDEIYSVGRFGTKAHGR